MYHSIGPRSSDDLVLCGIQSLADQERELLDEQRQERERQAELHQPLLAHHEAAGSIAIGSGIDSSGAASRGITATRDQQLLAHQEVAETGIGISRATEAADVASRGTTATSDRQLLAHQEVAETGIGISRATEAADVASRGTTATSDRQWWWPRRPDWLPLRDKETSLFLSMATDTAVMGLVTLAIFTATYLIAWGKPGARCIPSIPVTASNSTNSDGKHNTTPALSWLQIFSAILPFVVYPLALYSSGLAKVAETDKRALSSVATLCLCEFIIAIVLLGAMSYCTAGAAVAISLSMIGMLMVLIWGLTFMYPKWLRYFIWSKCFRQAEVDLSDDPKGHGQASQQPLHGS